MHAAVLDTHWREHLAALDYLRQGIHLRGYAQKNPKQEYKREAFELFGGMLERVKHEVVQLLARVRIRSEDEVEAMEQQQQPPGAGAAQLDAVPARRCRRRCRRGEPTSRGAEPRGDDAADAGACATRRRSAATIRARAASGKKYKQCHGKLA